MPLILISFFVLIFLIPNNGWGEEKGQQPKFFPQMKLPAARPRGFLEKSAVALPAFAKATAGPRHSSPPQDGGVFWRRRIKYDGSLRLYHSHLHDFIDISYVVEGRVDAKALKKINYLMRSRESGKVLEISLPLIHLLDHLQDHFGADTVEIISGYRSPAFNRHLKETGHHVSEHSFHMRGMAADIHLDEINERDVASYVNGLGAGGVGYYPDLLMVHVDVGPVEFWQEDSFSNRTDIGIFTGLDIAIKTDKLFYLPGEKMGLVLSNPKKTGIKPDLALEHFFRGEWLKLDPSTSSGRTDFNNRTPFVVSLSNHIPPALFGKFRWKLETMDGRYQYSNEFYLKKK